MNIEQRILKVPCSASAVHNSRLRRFAGGETATLTILFLIHYSYPLTILICYSLTLFICFLYQRPFAQGEWVPGELAVLDLKLQLPAACTPPRHSLASEDDSVFHMPIWASSSTSNPTPAARFRTSAGSEPGRLAYRIR